MRFDQRFDVLNDFIEGQSPYLPRERSVSYFVFSSAVVRIFQTAFVEIAEPIALLCSVAAMPSVHPIPHDEAWDLQNTETLARAPATGSSTAARAPRSWRSAVSWSSESPQHGLGTLRDHGNAFALYAKGRP